MPIKFRTITSRADEPMSKSTNKRQEAAVQRRQAILDAALEIFAEDGFAATRLDDVAEKAGVAKGTIYLSFKDKEDLFEQLLISAVAPVFDKMEALTAEPELSLDRLLQGIFALFRTQVLGTPRQDVIRLVITEGRRFPRIAKIYHREVISKGSEIVRRVARAAYGRGELSSDELARFPQLVFAPMLLATIWENVFSRIEPLDVEGLLAAHRQVLTRTAAKKSSRS